MRVNPLVRLTYHRLILVNQVLWHRFMWILFMLYRDSGTVPVIRPTSIAALYSGHGP